jgi:hypothetical protein
MDRLLEFAGKLIEESEGAVEWTESRDCFQALLPEDVRDRLGLPESFVTLSEGTGVSEETDHHCIGFGTELLERAVSTAIELGPTASIRMPFVSSRKQSDPDLARHFSFPNATFRFKGNHESWLDYWLWTFVVSADADERHEEVHHVCVSSSGACCHELPALILHQAFDWDRLQVEASEFPQKKLNALFMVACDRALRQLDEGLSGFKEAVQRHYDRDIRRIETYFRDLRHEMEEEIQHRQLDGAALEIRKEKMRRLSDEKSAKLRALQDKYRLRLKIRPITLLLARLPVRRFELLVMRRKEQKRISVLYNLLSRRFDPVPCDACGEDTYSLGFCDEALHVLCASCLAQFTAQKKCPRCRGKRPPSTIKQVLKRRGLEDGGEVL